MSSSAEETYRKITKRKKHWNSHSHAETGPRVPVPSGFHDATRSMKQEAHPILCVTFGVPLPPFDLAEAFDGTRHVDGERRPRYVDCAPPIHEGEYEPRLEGIAICMVRVKQGS